jgi:hypothetical protein
MKNSILSCTLPPRPFRVKEPFTGKVQVALIGIDPDEFAMMF